MTAARAADLAMGIAESVRELNHLTQHPCALRGPSELDQVVAELSIMAGRVPQLLGQLGRWLDAEHRAGRVRSDNPTNPGDVIDRADHDLTAAVAAAQGLCAALDAAHQHLAQLGTTDLQDRRAIPTRTQPS